MKPLLDYYHRRPLRFALLAGLFFRLLAAFFSEGFITSDDHFQVVEVAQGWIEGKYLDVWFVSDLEDRQTGRSAFYPGLHWVLFVSLDAIGFTTPIGKMILVRLFHAGYSLLIIYFGFRMVYQLAGRELAKKTGLVLALLWLLPVLSVRNLVEVAAIPAMLGAAWYSLSAETRQQPARWYMLSGVLLEVSFVFRYQVGLFVLGFLVGLALLRNWRGLMFTLLGAGIPFLLLHGVLEIYTGGAPFAKIYTYVMYNLKHATTYFNQPAWTYILFICGILIPPVGVFLFAGSFWAARKHWPTFLGVLLFFGFHSFFPNKQERFMFTMVPFFVILGLIGWAEIEARFPFWKNKAAGFVRGSWKFFWGLNLFVLAIVSWQSSKTMLVDAMTYMDTRTDVRAIVVEDMNRSRGTLIPLFYMREYPGYDRVGKKFPPDSLALKMQNYPDWRLPNYVLFVQKPGEDLTERVTNMETVVGPLQYDTTVQSGFIDRLYLKMNPAVAKADNMVVYHVSEEKTSE